MSEILSLCESAFVFITKHFLNEVVHHVFGRLQTEVIVSQVVFESAVTIAAITALLTGVHLLSLVFLTFLYMTFDVNDSVAHVWTVRTLVLQIQQLIK